MFILVYQFASQSQWLDNGRMKMKVHCILLVLLEICHSLIIQEAFVGETISLQCPSNDNSHRFQFWQLPNSIKETNVIGPGVTFNEIKYKYDVLTGTLHINELSTSEHGMFSCHCKNIFDDTFKVESIELIVKDNWDSSYEMDHMTNVYRCVIIASVSLILICILCILYQLRGRNVYWFPDLTGDSQSEQEDERFLPEAMEMTAHLDTEFPREFTTTAQIN